MADTGKPGLRHTGMGIYGHIKPGLRLTDRGLHGHIKPGLRLTDMDIYGHIKPGLRLTDMGMQWHIKPWLRLTDMGMHGHIKPGLRLTDMGFGLDSPTRVCTGILNLGLDSPTWTHWHGNVLAYQTWSRHTGTGMYWQIKPGLRHTGTGMYGQIKPGPRHTGTGMNEQIKPGPRHTGTGMYWHIKPGLKLTGMGMHGHIKPGLRHTGTRMYGHIKPWLKHTDTGCTGRSNLGLDTLRRGCTGRSNLGLDTLARGCTGALPVPLTDDFCLLALEKIRKRLGFDLEVRFLGHHRPPPGEVYVVDPVELRNHVNTSVPEHRTELSHEPPLKINVCYARIHDRNGSLQQNIKHIMEDCDHFEGRSFESERVIIAVDIPPGEHTTDVETELSRHVSNCLPENIPNENILVVLIRRPDKLQLAEAISTYIENMAIDGFETALTLLKKFVTSNRSRLNESFSTYFLNHPVEKCLHMFFHDYDTTNEKPGVRRVPIENMNDLSGQLHIADDLEGAVGGSDEQPEKCVKEDQRQEKATKETDFGCLLDNAGLYTLAGQIKCSVIVDYFSCKYNLPPCNVNDILESTNFKEKFVKSVSSVTKGFIFNYVELTKKGDYGWNHRVQVCVKRGKKPRIKTQRVSLKWLVSKVGHDIQGLVDDYEETMSNVEYIFSLLRKLTFEIEGYLLQGGRTEHQSYIPPPPTIPPEMRKSLLA
ncbi:hypothetical protein MAR_016934 [Mya arenaria]|uniref:Uncharacterized protein n=1 Tax=Mya arenaria TaxID=6604 RepID=A0ABY7EE13_MYAAR|nr:hypothetical protein MAR_016934 [Mya arenaria]